MTEEPQTKALHDLIRTGSHHHLKKGEPFERAGQEPYIHLIVGGYVKRYRVDADEGESIQLIYGPTDIFPLTPIFKLFLGQDIYDGPEQYRYACMTDVEYFSISAKKLVKAFQTNPNLSRDLLFICGKRLHTSIERLENLSLQSSDRRTAHHLARLARQSGKQLPNGILIRLPITQKELAEHLGLKQSTVARAVRSLRQEGLITGRGSIIVLNLTKLERRAYS